MCGMFVMCDVRVVIVVCGVCVVFNVVCFFVLSLLRVLCVCFV